MVTVRKRTTEIELSYAKLKSKLQKHEIRDHIAFVVIQEERGCIAYTIISSTNISVADAVVCAYKLETKNKLENYALSFRNNIKEQFTYSNLFPSPPTPDDIKMSNLLDFLPSALVHFLNLPIEGNADESNSKNTQRVVLSIAQVQQYNTHDQGHLQGEQGGHLPPLEIKISSIFLCLNLQNKSEYILLKKKKKTTFYGAFFFLFCLGAESRRSSGIARRGGPPWVSPF